MKGIKEEFRKKAAAHPEKYYATTVLKGAGYERHQCKQCSTYFWSMYDTDVCGDPACSGGFRFIGNPANEELDYVTVWKKFASLFEKKGYTPIERYPVAARWRKDTDFVQASIYDFQPYVVSGEVEPPANPLVVPQFCLRFNDIDNVGLTGAHYSGFDMIGQHAFMPENKWDQEKYFSDIHEWLIKGLKLPKEEIVYHEDAWAGGGNFGPSMEYFSRGLELGNQVYMMYEQTRTGSKPLNLRVLDMGMGHERNAWFALGSPTAYDATFPDVIKVLKEKTGFTVENEFQKKFLPYASYLNVDEVDDVQKTWGRVAADLNMGVDELKKKVLPMQGLFSVAEHARSLLVALADGVLPSNVGGGYNLRALYRRAQAFIDLYRWDVDIAELCRLHAKQLKPLYPELVEAEEQVKAILEVEKRKYVQTKEKARKLVARMVTKDISEETLIELYDSQGIAPATVKDEAKKQGKEVEVPDDFFARVAARHEQEEQEHQTVKEDTLDLEGVPETKILYYGDWKTLESKGKVLKVIGNNAVLDQTVFYPTSGGQLHDLGTISSAKVVDIFKQGPHIVHVVEGTIKEGDAVVCKVDEHRRTQLAIHHTATHIVQAAARKVLGEHINQAGAKKTMEHAHIDLTHYEALSKEEIGDIEKEANNIIYREAEVVKSLVQRTEAEQKFGMRIYQGGAVPGRMLRIVNIKDIDVQACGGTHLNNTREASAIKIERASKIQDGIVRLYFTAGPAAGESKRGSDKLVMDACALLQVTPPLLSGRVDELFQKWKRLKKAAKKKKQGADEDKQLISAKESGGDILGEVSRILKTQPEHVPKTIKRFLSEWKDLKQKT